jgi:hypothetical protein
VAADGAVTDHAQPEETARIGVLERGTVVGWPRSETGEFGASGQQASSLLAGVARVLMAARLADAPQHARVQALLVHAVQVAAQISRTIAARTAQAAGGEHAPDGPRPAGPAQGPQQPEQGR